MGLVDYASSSESETEPSTTRPSSTSKPAFQKVVDRSNPGVIKVNLTASPAVSNPSEPPPKRQRTGGLSGLNALLPPPKRTGVVGNGSRGLGAGLQSGISLKTGSERGFERTNGQENTGDGEGGGGGSDAGLQLPPPKGAVETTPIPADEVKLVGKPTMFRPLSVARNGVKKKKPTTAPTNKTQSAKPIDTAGNTGASAASTTIDTPAPRPKVSLFSISTEEVDDAEEGLGSNSAASYQPLLYGTEPPTENSTEIPQDNDFTSTHLPIQQHPSQSLTALADDLHLTPSERRQLFGRNSKAPATTSTTSIINFNTDAEYLHNQALIASGEAVVSHNPVRSINPGKHSLKQLVEIASSNKQALEESFAQGRNNRGEAKGKYGW